MSSAEPDPVPVLGFSANDEVVAHLIIYSTSHVVFQFTDALDTDEGRAWLRRRVAVASDNLGSAAARQTEDFEVVEV